MIVPPHNGLKCRDVSVKDGEIRVQSGRTDQDVIIGELDLLFDLPHYEEGEYETENGFKINLCEFINHLTFSLSTFRDIRDQSPTPNDGEMLSDRMVEFNRILINRLEANLQ